MEKLMELLSLFPISTEPVLMALLGVLLGAWIAYKFNIQVQLRKEKNEKDNITNLLLLDMETLWNRYDQVIGRFIEQDERLDNPPLDLPIESSYFTVFDSLAQKLGMLEKEVALKLLRFYQLAKVYNLDTLTRYNELCNRHRELRYMKIGNMEALQTPQMKSINIEIDNCLKQLQILFLVLKKEHNSLKVFYREALESLKESGRLG